MTSLAGSACATTSGAARGTGVGGAGMGVGVGAGSVAGGAGTTSPIDLASEGTSAVVSSATGTFSDSAGFVCSKPAKLGCASSPFEATPPTPAAGKYWRNNDE